MIEQEKLEQCDIIMLKYLKRIDQQRFALYKIFNSVDVRDKNSLFYTINTYADGFFGQNEDYSVDIDRLELDIIKALKGGCQTRELKTNDSSKRVVHPKAANNNCFFKCIQPFIPQLMTKIVKSAFNKIRREFGLQDNQEVDLQTALKTFTHYSNGLSGLEIWTNDTLIVEVKGPSPTLRLLLNENHYSMLTFKEMVAEQKCTECGRKFKYSHNCNTNGMVCYKIHVDNNRYVINQFNEDCFNYDETNDDVVVYYDIETHTKKQVGNSKIHTPYIVGFVDNVRIEFQYFAGSNCMEMFINHLHVYKFKKKVYLNALDGSKFDHYEFVKQLGKMMNQTEDAQKLNKLLLNNGSILRQVWVISSALILVNIFLDAILKRWGALCKKVNLIIASVINGIKCPRKVNLLA